MGLIKNAYALRHATQNWTLATLETSQFCPWRSAKFSGSSREDVLRPRPRRCHDELGRPKLSIEATIVANTRLPCPLTQARPTASGLLSVYRCAAHFNTSEASLHQIQSLRLHAAITQSIGSPSLSFHLVSRALLGIPNGSTTLCATSTPATGKPFGSSRPSCKAGRVSLLPSRRQEESLAPAQEQMPDPSICTWSITMASVVITVYTETYMCLHDSRSRQSKRSPPPYEESSLEGQLVSPERDHADKGYFQRLASRFDARQEVVNFLKQAHSVGCIFSDEAVLRTVV